MAVLWMIKRDSEKTENFGCKYIDATDTFYITLLSGNFYKLKSLFISLIYMHIYYLQPLCSDNLSRMDIHRSAHRKYCCLLSTSK